MAPFVDLFVVWNMDHAIAFGRNDSLGVLLSEGFAQVICIECLVREHGIKRQTFDQSVNANNLAALAWKQFKADKISQGIGERENLCGQSAFRAPNGLIESPPFAPLAFW